MTRIQDAYDNTKFPACTCAMPLFVKEADCPAHGSPQVDMVNHPPHYSSHPSGVECIKVTRHQEFDAGNGFKYVYRRGDKGSLVQDLDKALWYWGDMLKNATNIWIPGRYFEAREALHLVIDAEPDPIARRFYISVDHGARHPALEALQELRATV